VSASLISAIFCLNNSFSAADIFWIAPPIPQRRVGVIDQHVPQLDVCVHYAGSVERVQRYQEVAEELLHLPLGQVIILLLLIIIIVVLSPAVGAIVITPADGCGTAHWRCIAVAPLPMMMASPWQSHWELGPACSSTSAGSCCACHHKLPRVVIPPPSLPPPSL
jgi:hypothetical protein